MGVTIQGHDPNGAPLEILVDDDGTIHLMGVLGGQLPGALGPQPSAESLSVVLATPTASTSVSRAEAALPADGDFDIPAGWVAVVGGQISVIVKYTADPGGTDGYPAYRLAWRVSIGGFDKIVYPTIDLASVMPDGAEGPVKRLRLRKDCFDLIDGSASFGLDVYDVPPGATGARVELAEAGDITAPGTAGAWIGRTS